MSMRHISYIGFICDALQFLQSKMDKLSTLQVPYQIYMLPVLAAIILSKILHRVLLASSLAHRYTLDHFHIFKTM